MKVSELLRKVRKEKGLSIGQVAKDLYLQEKYLQALEEGNFEIIPGEVFLKAYFWKYADYLGLKEYIESLTQAPSFEPDEKEPPMDEIFGGEWDATRWWRVGLKLGLPIIIILFIVMGVMARNNEPTPVDEPERVEGTRSQQLEVVPTEIEGPSWEIPRGSGGAGSLDNLNEQAHQLTLRAIGECWVTLNTREGNLYLGNLYAGDVVTYNDLIGFYLSAGRPEKLEVEFNGELIPWEPGVSEMVLPVGASVFADDDDETEEDSEEDPESDPDGEPGYSD